MRHAGDMQPASVRPDRALIVIVFVIVILVVVALVVVFTRGAPADVDPSTPEGAVQSYARAVIANDRDTALDLLSADVRENCDRAEPNTVKGLRMTVVSTKVSGSTAVVEVTISHGTGDDLFGGSRYTSDESFAMVSEDGEWKVDYAPWEFMLCFNQGKY